MIFHPRTLSFIKASACGNDFLLIDAGLGPADMGDFTRRICDRHDGVGANGVEWMLPHASADAEVRLINADGSEAEISGNGTRCVAAYLCAERGGGTIRIQTGAGLKTCSLMGRRDSEYEFEMEMGKAGLGGELTIRLGNDQVRGVSVSLGNPHCVVFVSEFENNWQALAAEIQRDPQFKQGVNVELVIAENTNAVRALFFERGVGETRSSGTGSCAAAVAAVETGRASWPVRVHAPGGTQTVRKEEDRVFLRGPARLLCRGEFFLE
ncbi:MAG TPA: diaminopimelate epimerase [Candidatus Sulfotelmatobacter sp.]